MSRSRKKAIIKDKGEWNYNKIVRRVNKQIIKQFKKDYRELVNETFELYNRVEGLEETIKNPKEIINDYDYCDYIIDFEHTLKNWPKETVKNRRK